MTSRRRAASKFLARPLTIEEQTGIPSAKKIMRAETTRLYVCKFCGQAGGTMRKISKDVYAHQECRDIAARAVRKS
ncbi:MAG: hypothetical protein PHQ43_16080 [Dehalococcoidales bacterium]|nr:hypothetical protein [Dehalococcoidales bacterium]